MAGADRRSSALLMLSLYGSYGRRPLAVRCAADYFVVLGCCSDSAAAGLLKDDFSRAR